MCFSSRPVTEVGGAALLELALQELTQTFSLCGFAPASSGSKNQILGGCFF